MYNLMYVHTCAKDPSMYMCTCTYMCTQLHVHVKEPTKQSTTCICTGMLVVLTDVTRGSLHLHVHVHVQAKSPHCMATIPFTLATSPWTDLSSYFCHCFLLLRSALVTHTHTHRGKWLRTLRFYKLWEPLLTMHNVHVHR